jgi:hypothetical protein
LRPHPPEQVKRPGVGKPWSAAWTQQSWREQSTGPVSTGCLRPWEIVLWVQIMPRKGRTRDKGVCGKTPEYCTREHAVYAQRIC